MVKIHQWGPKKQTFFFVFSVFSVFSGCRVTLLNMLQTTWNNRVCVFLVFFTNMFQFSRSCILFPTSRGFSLPPMTLIVEAGQASFAARHLRHQNAHQKALKHLCKTNLQHHVKIVSYRASSNQQATEVEVYHLGPARGPNEEIWGKYLTHKNWTCQPIHWLLHPHLLLTKSGILQAGLQD